MKLDKILNDHEKWLNNCGGDKADLSYTDLSSAGLNHANLRDANLRGADLSNADLRDIDLSYADLINADLNHANLRDANLINADLRSVDLRDADLRGANLSNADLINADLRGVDLSNIKTNEHTLGVSNLCPEEGSFIGYKKARNCLIKLKITEDAKRSNATTKKCRCSKAKVLKITDLDTGKEKEKVASNWDGNFIYKKGKIVEVSDFDEDRWNECSTGIHFFIDKRLAINY